jgi:hypothetical protein
MSRWSLLFAQVDALDVSGRRAASNVTDFEQWGDGAELALVDELFSIAERRAADMAQHTDVAVSVARSHPGPDLALRGARISVLELALGATRVYVYSVRERGQSPAVHLAVRRDSPSTRHPVLASLPGCLVVRSEDGAATLLPLPRPLDATPTELHPTPDDLVFRAFELLVATQRSVVVTPDAAIFGSGSRTIAKALA